MKDHQNYLYHPFTHSSFGMLIAKNNGNTNVNMTKNGQLGFVVENIDLYYQPLEHPYVAVCVFVIKSFFITIGIFLCVKVLRMAKKEPSIVTQMVEIFCWSQIIIQPIAATFDLTVNLFHPVNEFIGHWYCSLQWLFGSLLTKLVLPNSFFISLMRYVFIVHNPIVNRHGKEKIKRYFLYFYLIACIFGVLVEGVDNRELSRYSFINKCYGKDHKVFLIETSTLNILKRKFWEIESDAFEKYGQTMDLIFSMAVRTLRLFNIFIFLLTGFNAIEGILYFNVFSYMQR